MGASSLSRPPAPVAPDTQFGLRLQVVFAGGGWCVGGLGGSGGAVCAAKWGCGGVKKWHGVPF